MTDNPFAHLSLDEAIALRWVLRDIRGRRWKLSPIDPGDLEKLIGMGLVEMRNEDPELTQSGLDLIA
jgi:hypothetical protein